MLIKGALHTICSSKLGSSTRSDSLITGNYPAASVRIHIFSCFLHTKNISMHGSKLTDLNKRGTCTPFAVVSSVSLVVGILLLDICRLNPADSHTWWTLATDYFYFYIYVPIWGSLALRRFDGTSWDCQEQQQQALRYVLNGLAHHVVLPSDHVVVRH